MRENALAFARPRAAMDIAEKLIELRVVDRAVWN
jgi:hypothetical protein